MPEHEGEFPAEPLPAVPAPAEPEPFPAVEVWPPEPAPGFPDPPAPWPACGPEPALPDPGSGGLEVSEAQATTPLSAASNQPTHRVLTRP